MNPSIERQLIPRGDTVRLINQLQELVLRLKDTAEQMRLLTDAGRVPQTPDFSSLIQHAAEAQGLSHEVVNLAAQFTQTPHSTNRAGSAVLAHLATAATLSAFAAPHFAETAEAALALPRSCGPTDRQYAENRMVIDHATARAYLRRTSDSLRDAVKVLDEHLDLHRFFPTPSRPDSPALLPPKPGTHRF
ncbi:hypothetical protein [Streptomyces sp. H39-C1]|uniref:hypothetical protein n=1 Tax=Streptomyces sp. H39-C1 TaxID=3004355 RepID=UPI0022B035A5|nr:hypothetical protein [Streptomyces sp. H39-C1]MCZ4102357.1 hypothetical protein [Streptomyces sp. H39-C1]